MKCLQCHGTGSYPAHAPDCGGFRSCEATCPVQVQCVNCAGTGYVVEDE